MTTAGGAPGPTAANVQAPHFAPAGGGAAAPAGAGGTAGAPGATPGAGLSAAAEAAVRARGTPATLNLDDIFGDCFFTPEGDTVFLGDQPAEVRQAVVSSAEAPGGVATVASRPGAVAPQAQAAAYVPVPVAGGIATTGLDRPGASATVMGTAPAAAAAAQDPGAPASAATTAPAAATPTPATPSSVGFAQPPQRRHHLPFATPAMTAAVNAAQAASSKRKSDAAAARERKMSDKQKVERRERNREHAKRSRIRKKFLLESLQQSVSLLKEENEKLRNSIRAHLPEEAEELLKAENLAEAAAAAGGGLIANSSSDANKVLDDPDFSFIKALQTAQQNFVVTDPSLPDNPIVYATQGFLNLTGYTLDQVLGRNCRFLQGPETDPKAVEKIRRAIEDGTDMSVCLLNYRVDGTTFWNQFFIAALRDAAGNITNYVGVQCKVSDQYAANVCRRQEEAEQAEAEAQAAAASAAECAGGGEPQAPVAMDTDMGSAAAATASVSVPAPSPASMAPPQVAPAPAVEEFPAATAPAPVQAAASSSDVVAASPAPQAQG